MAASGTPMSTLSAAARSLELFAMATGQFDMGKSSIVVSAPFPSSLYTGLGDDRLLVLDELVAALTELRNDWAAHGR